MRFLFACGLLFALAGAARAETLPGVVIVVIDGDTVLFRPDHYQPTSRAFVKIRLAGIDAPEKDQPYGGAATRALTALALNQRVQMEIVATDVYGRKVARLMIGSLPVDAEMVRRGFAWASTRSRRDSVLMDVQREARNERRGLWQDAAPTPPWMWRREHPAFPY